MSRAELSFAEMETILNVVPSQVSNLMNVWTCTPSEIRYFSKLAADHPEEVHVIKKNSSEVELEFPSAWYRRPKPPAKKNLTEEQRAAAAARLAAAREKRREV